MTKLKFLIIITIIVFISYYLISFFSTFHLYAAGSYPYAETYYLKYSEKEVINALEELKLKNAHLVDNDTTDYWHEVYFDLGDKKVQTWTRPINKNETNFALVAVYKNKKWQLVNQDLGLLGNIMLKREFEKLIIERLKIELKK